MISAARGQTAPYQPACSGPLLLVWPPVNVAAQPFMILAAAFYQIPWLAVTLLVLSIPLPWVAVLVANDRLPKKAEKTSRYRPDRRQIEQREHPIIEGQ